MTERINLNTVEGLADYLNGFGIPVRLWGQGEAKTVGHLLKEIESRETILRREGEELLRLTQFVTVDVIYRQGNEIYDLVEDRQEFKDGRIRRRNTGNSVSEKMKPREDPKEAADRALREELGITGEISITGGESFKKLKEGISYPGLITQYVRYGFAAALNSDQYSPNGYVEEQDDKTTYFVWRKR